MFKTMLIKTKCYTLVMQKCLSTKCQKNIERKDRWKCYIEVRFLHRGKLTCHVPQFTTLWPISKSNCIKKFCLAYEMCGSWVLLIPNDWQSSNVMYIYWQSVTLLLS